MAGEAPMPYRPVVIPTVVAVGASGGEGLEGLRALLGALPGDLDAIVLVELHRPCDRPSQLSEVLSRTSRLPVRHARDGESLRPGVCYVGEPNAHLTLAPDHRARLVAAGDHLYRGGTVDLLFRSVAENAGPRAVGVVLPGSLSDGAAGLAEIVARGGRAFVVGVDGAALSGMPRNAAAAVRAARIMRSADQLAKALSVAPAA
jgi:two-component system chemotaxis response regulator CheB